jgi:hypothetical protein
MPAAAESVGLEGMLSFWYKICVPVLKFIFNLSLSANLCKQAAIAPVF